MAINVINQSSNVKDEDMSNAMANMYDNNAEFREMIDDLHASGYPINIRIQDDPLSEDAQSKGHPSSHANSVSKVDNEGNRILTGVDVVISAQSFIDNRFGVDKDGDGHTDQTNEKGRPDATAHYTFERVLTHELYHARDWTSGTMPPHVQNHGHPDNKAPYELRAAEFENRVIAASSAPNDPNSVPRNYYGDRGVFVSSSYSEKPHFIDKSPPQQEAERPWAWKKETTQDATLAVKEMKQDLRTVYNDADNQPAGAGILLPTSKSPIDPKESYVDFIMNHFEKEGESPAEYTDARIVGLMQKSAEDAAHQYDVKRGKEENIEENTIDFSSSYGMSPRLYAQTVIDAGIVKDENGQPVHFNSPEELIESVRGDLQKQYDQKHAPQNPSVETQVTHTTTPDKHMHRSSAHPKIDTPQQTQSNFMPTPTDDTANKSAFTPDVAAQQQAPNTAVEPITPEPALPPSPT